MPTYLAAAATAAALLALTLGLIALDARRARRLSERHCPHCGAGYRVGRDLRGVRFQVVTTWEPSRRTPDPGRTEIRQTLTCDSCQQPAEFDEAGRPVSNAEGGSAPAPIDWPPHFLRREGNA